MSEVKYKDEQMQKTGFAMRQLLSAGSLFAEQIDTQIVKDLVDELERELSRATAAMPILAHSMSITDMHKAQESHRAKIKLYSALGEFVDAVRESKKLGIDIDAAFVWPQMSEK